MPGPFHLCAKGCHTLELTGIPPGLFAATSYETLTVRLEQGDAVRCSFSPMGSPTPLTAPENSLESSGCRSFAMRIGAVHPPSC